VLALDFRVISGVRVKIRAGVRDSWDTKRLGTKRLGYEMSGSGREDAPWSGGGGVR